MRIGHGEESEEARREECAIGGWSRRVWKHEQANRVMHLAELDLQGFSVELKSRHVVS